MNGIRYGVEKSPPCSHDNRWPIKIQREEDKAERLKMKAELLSKCAGSKVKKTKKPSQKVSTRTSHSEKTESEEDEEFDSEDVDRMFKGI